jgi:hypothetical protein
VLPLASAEPKALNEPSDLRYVSSCWYPVSMYFNDFVSMAVVSCLVFYGNTNLLTNLTSCYPKCYCKHQYKYSIQSYGQYRYHYYPYVPSSNLKQLCWAQSSTCFARRNRTAFESKTPNSSYSVPICHLLF